MIVLAHVARFILEHPWWSILIAWAIGFLGNKVSTGFERNSEEVDTTETVGGAALEVVKTLIFGGIPFPRTVYKKTRSYNPGWFASFLGRLLKVIAVVIFIAAAITLVAALLDNSNSWSTPRDMR